MGRWGKSPRRQQDETLASGRIVELPLVRVVRSFARPRGWRIGLVRRCSFTGLTIWNSDLIFPIFFILFCIVRSNSFLNFTSYTGSFSCSLQSWYVGFHPVHCISECHWPPDNGSIERSALPRKWELHDFHGFGLKVRINLTFVHFFFFSFFSSSSIFWLVGEAAPRLQGSSACNLHRNLANGGWCLTRSAWWLARPGLECARGTETHRLSCVTGKFTVISF